MRSKCMFLSLRSVYNLASELVISRQLPPPVIRMNRPEITPDSKYYSISLALKDCCRQKETVFGKNLRP